MIPSIETIVEDLLAGTITKQQAIAWLNQHADTAYASLRDEFAAAAMQGMLGLVGKWTPFTLFTHTITYPSHELVAQKAYAAADAMLAERAKPQGANHDHR